MTRDEIKTLRDASFAKIVTIYKDVTEKRWDNTHTAGQLRACLAMHEAATRQLVAMKAGGIGNIAFDDVQAALNIVKKSTSGIGISMQDTHTAIAYLESALELGGAS